MQPPVSTNRQGEPTPAPVARPHEPAPPGTPLYVHLPFCVQKCTYCDFYSVVSDGQDLAGTLDALLVEARHAAPSRPRTVFLGGGTPSLYEPAELARFLDGLDAACGFRESAVEVTAECNPESLDLETARALRAGGVDRLTIGFQSLEPRLLELFGRAHSVKDSFRAFEAARAAGFRRVGIDLIHAAPGQRLERWEAELRRVLALGPDHLSAYTLAFEEGTTFTRWLEDGRLSALDEEQQLAFFRRTRELVEASGLAAYEVSNFASSGQECAHNVNYWHNGPYVGLGPSAVSKLGFTRFGNARSIVAWRAGVEALASGAGRVAWSETLDPAARLAETWWLGLRLAAGVEPERARASAGWAAADDPAERLAHELAAAGWLEPRGSAWRLSDAGLPLADAIAAEFLRPRSPGDTRASAEPLDGSHGVASSR